MNEQIKRDYEAEGGPERREYKPVSQRGAQLFLAVVWLAFAAWGCLMFVSAFEVVK